MFYLLSRNEKDFFSFTDAFDTVNKKLGDTVFVGFENHSIVKNHKLIVLKNIVSLYAKTRINHFARTHCWTVKKRIRKKMSKLILFKNQ